MNLPEPLENFLDHGERLLKESKSCAGVLRNNFSADVWILQSIEPSGNWVKREHYLRSVPLNWRAGLGSTSLTNRRWRRLLRDCRLLMAAEIGSGMIQSATLKRHGQFHDQLIALVEHLVVQYPEEAAELGLSVLTHERAVIFLTDHLSGGVCRTGCWQARWCEYVISQASGMSDQEMAGHISGFAYDVRNVILDLKRTALTHSDTGKFVVPVPDIDERSLLKARIWLAANAWFDEAGCLPIGRVATAIGVDRSRACHNSDRLRHELTPFEICTDYRRHDHFRAAKREHLDARASPLAVRASRPLKQSTQNQAYSLVSTIARLAPHVASLGLDFSTQLAVEHIPRHLRGGAGGRTPTMSVDTALFAFDRMIQWTLAVTKPLCLLAEKVVSAFVRIERASPSQSRISALNQALSCAEIPDSLLELGLHAGPAQCGRKKDEHSNGDGTTRLAREIRENGISLLDALALNGAILAALIAAFCMRRKTEILALRFDALVRSGGKTHIRVNLAKRGLDGGRDTSIRPIPTFLWQGLSEYARLGMKIRASMGEDLVPSDCPLFWSFTKVTTAPVSMRPEILSRYLTFFCDWIEIPLDHKARRWYIRFHELRRFSALCFFRVSGMQTSLPALSWMLGHSDVNDTWRYIQEELTGEELTQTEVAMAHAALLEHQEIGAVQGSQRLAEVVKKHFGTCTLTLIDPDELDDYLTLLREQNMFRAEPHSVTTPEGRAVVVIIHVRKGVEDG